jgi:hypothetical protein
MRARTCASARTITHPLATMPTQGEDDRVLVGEVLGAAGFGVEVTGAATSESATLPPASVVSRGLTVSGGAAAMTRAALSDRAAVFGADCVDSRCRAATFGLGSRAWEPSHTAAVNAATAIHLPAEEGTFRVFSAVSVVPHHLHE